MCLKVFEIGWALNDSVLILSADFLVITYFVSLLIVSLKIVNTSDNSISVQNNSAFTTLT